MEEKMSSKRKLFFKSPVFDARIRLFGSNGKVMKLKYTDYANMLSAAKKWGWCPFGVVPSINDTENESPLNCLGEGYFLNSGTVIDVDARGIADALVRMMYETESEPYFFYSVSGLFDYDQKEPKDIEELWKMCSKGTIEMVNTLGGFLVVTPFDMDCYLIHSRKAVLKKFIKFCRAGSFSFDDFEGC